jgi:hypothetical protein
MPHTKREIASWLKREGYMTRWGVDPSSNSNFVVVELSDGPFSIVSYEADDNERKITTEFDINEVFEALTLYQANHPVMIRQLLCERNMGGYRRFREMEAFLKDDAARGIQTNYTLRRTVEFEGRVIYPPRKFSPPSTYNLVKKAVGFLCEDIPEDKKDDQEWCEAYIAGMQRIVEFFSHTRSKAEIEEEKATMRELERLKKEEEFFG